MHRHHVILWLVTILGILGCACWRLARSPQPSATMRIIEYSFGNDSIVASVQLTNDGPCTFVYGDLGYGQGGIEHRVVAIVDGVATNYAERCGIVSGVVFPPHSSTGFTVTLPPHTQSWRCIYPCHRPSARERALDWMIESGVLQKHLNRMMDWLAHLLPSARASTIDIQSPLFEVPDSRPNPQPALDGAGPLCVNPKPPCRAASEAKRLGHFERVHE